MAQKSDTFANRLRYLIEKNNITQSELSEKTTQFGKTISQPLINKYLKGKALARQDNLTILATILNVNEAWLMGYDVPYEKDNALEKECNVFPLMDKPVAIPIVGKIAAGLPILAEENIIDYAFVPEREHSKRPNAFYLTVYGDSMNEKFKDGDLVLVDPDVEVENGDIAVVLVENEATVKEFHKEDNLIVLYPKSTNKEHQMQIYNPKKIKIKIIGKVVSFQGKV